MAIGCARCKQRRRSIFLAVLCAVGTGVIIFCWPMDIAPYVRISSSGEMLDRSGRLMYAFLNENEDWCFERGLDEISPRLVQATIAAEDQRFHIHPGVDPIAVLRAAWRNLTRRRILSGASTLAMQVVRLSHRRDGTSCGKLFQAIRALRLEARVSRNDILHVYLNTAPYGGNLVGCEAAARCYFGKPAKELILPEAALLAGLPKAPSLYSPFKSPERALARRRYVLQRMYEEGFITESELREARKQPLDVRKHPFPKQAPHLAMQLKPELDRGGKLRTTLDANVQTTAERFVKEGVQNTGGEIENGAAIVVDVDTAEVLAWVGSADFFNTPGGGQVDVCRAPRSPGSALKPFAYGLAMDKNCLYAYETLLDDTWDRGLYNPENFDLQYRGLVSASDALRQSLNVPAVTTLQRLGVENLYTFLKEIGITTLLRSSDHYGLGLILGNCEVTLEELSAAYSTLANLGEYRSLTTRMGAPVRPSERVLSRGICLKLYEMLEQPLPAELDHDTIQAVNVTPRVCWKTGTSHGYRDAWTFVFNRHYVVGVWMGNNDARPSRRLVGARAALPLAGKLFRVLPLKNDPAWPEVDGALREVSICAVSGLPAARWCPHTRNVFLPREQYLHRLCDMHYPAPKQDPRSNPIRTVIERWPGSAQNWDLAKVQLPVTPLFDRHRGRVGRREDLRILEPPHQAEYLLTGERGGDRIRLRTSVDAQTRLHWYVDDHYLGDSAPSRPLFLKLQAGRHRLTCMTPGGKTHTVSYKALPFMSPVKFAGQKSAVAKQAPHP